MKKDIDLVNIFTYVVATIMIIGLAASGCLIIYGCCFSYKCETNIYTGNISDINDNNIILQNNKVIFADNINNFEWELGTQYEITVKSFFTDKTIKNVKIIEKQKETNDRN